MQLADFLLEHPGKPLEALLDVRHEIPCEPELVFLQEEGGTFEESQHEYLIDEFHPKDGYDCTALASCFCKVCMLVRTDLVPHMLFFLQFRMSGSMLFAASLHLPHSQREDVDSVWETTILKLHGHMRRIRHQDHVCIGIDANLELCMPCDGSFRSIHASEFMNLFGLQATSPTSRTWWNHACVSQTDYILHGGIRLEFRTQHVREWIGHLLPCDHALVCATVQATKVLKLPRRGQCTKCGEWQVNLQTALEACKKLQEDIGNRIQEGCFGLCLHELVDLAHANAFRPKSFRFADPPSIKVKIAERRTLQGDQALSIAAEIVALRRAAKQQWLADVLHRAKCANFAAFGFYEKKEIHEPRSCKLCTQSWRRIQSPGRPQGFLFC